MSSPPSTPTTRIVGQRAWYLPFVTYDELRVRLSAAVRAEVVAGRSRQEIVDALGLTAGWLDHVEAGRREPKLDKLARLAEVLRLQLVVELVQQDSPMARLLELAADAPAGHLSAACAMLEKLAETESPARPVETPPAPEAPRRRRGALRAAR